MVRYTQSTGIDGRLRERTSEDPRSMAVNQFSDNQKQLDDTTRVETTTYPVGSFQSKSAAAPKLHYRTKYRDLNISIENRAGSYRYWYDSAADREGKTLQKYPYGYIRLTEGMDGDHVDCYVGPNHDAKNVYVITTNKAPEFKEEDEQKCMLGFDSAAEAKQAFLQHYDNPKFFRALKALPYEEFKTKALLTRTVKTKKIALDLIQVGPGSFDGQIPGDRLGLPFTKNPRQRAIIGDDMPPDDKIDRSFRHMDEPMNTRVLEGTGGLPESPSV